MYALCVYTRVYVCVWSGLARAPHWFSCTDIAYPAGEGRLATLHITSKKKNPPRTLDYFVLEI